MSVPKVLVGSRRWLFARLVALGVVQAGAATATVLLVKHTFDEHVLGAGSSDSELAYLGGGLLVALAVSSWCRKSERVQAERMGQDYVDEIRKRVFRHLTRLEPRVISSHSRGGLLLRFLGDLAPLRQWISLGFARFVLFGITAAFTLVLLALLNVVLAAWVALALAVGGTLSILVGLPLSDAVREVRRRRSRLTTNVSEMISAMPIVQVYGQERREARRVRRQSRRLVDASIARARIIGRLRLLTQATTGTATLGVLLLGVREVGLNNATPGDVVAGITLVGLLLPPLRDLGRVHEFWHGARVSRQKLETLLATEPFFGRGQATAESRPVEGELALRNVVVRDVIQSVEAVARPGERVAIVGPNGAGKTTLLRLVARLQKLDGGSIELDGRKLSSLPLEQLRAVVSMASPDLTLLRGSLRRNLSYRDRDASREELNRIAKLCAVDSILARLPAGEETRVKEGGSDLSAGERGRLMLARALLGGPRVLLLDEIEASFDAEGRAAFLRVLRDFPATILTATHDPEIVALCDTVWHLEGGRLLRVAQQRQDARPTDERAQS